LIEALPKFLLFKVNQRYSKTNFLLVCLKLFCQLEPFQGLVKHVLSL